MRLFLSNDYARFLLNHSPISWRRRMHVLIHNVLNPLYIDLIRQPLKAKTYTFYHLNQN